MKKAINQSLMVYILNGISILAMLFLVYSLMEYSAVNSRLDTAHEERFELTYNANRFMNGSAYLTNEVRAFSATGMQEHIIDRLVFLSRLHVVHSLLLQRNQLIGQG